MREQWEAFDTGNLAADTTKDLLRLCGFAPRETEIAVPRSFEEFEALSQTIAAPMGREEMKRMVGMFSHNAYISRKDLNKYLRMGDKLDDEEMNGFLRMCPFDDNGEVTISELVDLLHGSEE